MGSSWYFLVILYIINVDIIGVCVVVVNSVVILVNLSKSVIFLLLGNYNFRLWLYNMLMVRLINSVGVKILLGALELLFVSMVYSL